MKQPCRLLETDYGKNQRFLEYNLGGITAYLTDFVCAGVLRRVKQSRDSAERD